MKQWLRDGTFFGTGIIIGAIFMAVSISATMIEVPVKSLLDGITHMYMCVRVD